MEYINYFWRYAIAYAISIGGLWGTMEMYSYFKNDELRNLLGDYWWTLYLTPLPFIFAFILRDFYRRTPVRGWEALINNHLSDVKVYGSVQEEPRVEIVDNYIMSADEIDEATKNRPEINDLHAMCSDEPVLIQRPVAFHVKTLDFASLKVLRKRDKHEYVLSASVVVVCRKRKMLILHHRSKDSATYPDSLHTLGGAYQPNVDGPSLVKTGKREVLEEIGASVLAEEVPPMVLALESTTRFLQLVILGANITGRQCDNLSSNWEAEGIVKIPFDDLRRRLIESIRIKDSSGKEREIGWVPSGKAHVLSWLAHGAPGAGLKPSFNGLSPEALFNDIVG